MDVCSMCDIDTSEEKECGSSFCHDYSRALPKLVSAWCHRKGFALQYCGSSGMRVVEASPELPPQSGRLRINYMSYHPSLSGTLSKATKFSASIPPCPWSMRFRS